MGLLDALKAEVDLTIIRPMIVDVQVGDPLKAMVTGAPLEDARNLTQRYDRLRQEAEALVRPPRPHFSCPPPHTHLSLLTPPPLGYNRNLSPSPTLLFAHPSSPGVQPHSVPLTHTPSLLTRFLRVQPGSAMLATAPLCPLPRRTVAASLA